jgi:hypothetical protein
MKITEEQKAEKLKVLTALINKALCFYQQLQIR